jgi:hypothetical protein
MIGDFRHSDRPERFSDGLTLRGQRVNLSKLCNDLLGAVPSSRHPDDLGKFKSELPAGALFGFDNRVADGWE